MTEDEFVLFLKDCLGLAEEDPNNKSFDKEGLDSINKVRLIVLIEEYSGNDISIIEILECCNVNDILLLVKK